MSCDSKTDLFICLETSLRSLWVPGTVLGGEATVNEAAPWLGAEIVEKSINYDTKREEE